MFPELDTKETPTKQKLLATDKLFVVAACLLAACFLSLTVFFYAKYRAAESRTVTPEIAARLNFLAYTPQKLPGAYKVAKQTVTLSENDTVLLFQARDGVGGDLIFSEQAKSKNFNFEEFYKNEFTDARTLSDVPYPSVWGTTSDGRRGLSIVAGDTWIFMITSAPLGSEEMTRIAAGIRN